MFLLPPGGCVALEAALTASMGKLSRHEKSASIAKWDRSYREPDPAAPEVLRHPNAVPLCLGTALAQATPQVPSLACVVRLV